MAALVGGFSLRSLRRNSCRLPTFLSRHPVSLNPVRSTAFFRHLSKKKEHNLTDYEYEVTQDPNVWQWVDKLMPLKTIPVPQKKDHYSSGWRPMKEEALKLPYFVERSRNHMLSVYLCNYHRGQLKVTKVTRIHGNLWQLYDELKAHLEEKTGRKLASHVHEGNRSISFKGDHVYFTEQWLLSKGF